MATSAQILANQENSKLSTGPCTEAGKARSAANSTSHGLSSAFNVLPTEDLEEYDEVMEGFIEEFAPTGYHETFLVQQMVHARWRILRITRLENRLLADASTDAQNPADADSAILRNMLEKGVDVASALARYHSIAERSYYKAHREIINGRARAAQTEASGARRERAEAEAAFIELLNAPMPVPDLSTYIRNEARTRSVTLESKKPVVTPLHQQHADKSSSGSIETSHANRQGL